MKYYYKIKMLLAKIQHQTNIEMEKKYIQENYGNIIKKDTDSLRNKLAELREKEKPTSKDKEEIIKLEEEINEVIKYRAIIERANQSIIELRMIIETIKNDLW